ncbi:hypothetical protein [Halobacillus mangrovi]|uniref:hypothetical protein n=1 Tax=Halobacillus mangrovi TaxID=402384 RepID=UPI003D985160
MSNFIKGTSIIGVIVLGIGIWQLTVSDGIGQNKTAEKTEQTEEKTDETHYQTVTVQSEEEQSENLKRPDYSGQTLVKDTVVASIKNMINEDNQIRELIHKIGEDRIQDDLAYGAHSYDWRKLESDTEEKQQWIDQLIELSDHKQLNEMAEEASVNFSKSLKQKDLNYYFEATKKFQYLRMKL